VAAILFGTGFARLKAGTERDRAGNRRLFMDQYCALILMALFSPAIQSLRDLQRGCTLDKVRKRLGVNRASLGSLPESVAILDPASLKEIAAELGHTIRSRPGRPGAATASSGRGIGCCAVEVGTQRGAAHSREPALLAERNQDGEARAASSERRSG
jgi:hypothetical protein